MGNTQPTNKTGRKVIVKKLENAQKTNILSLTEHGLDDIPSQVFQIKTLKTLDLSQNKIKHLGDQLAVLKDLKSLNVDQNALVAGSLKAITSLTKLQTLSAGGNKLGTPFPKDPRHPKQPAPAALPTLPVSLKQLKLDANSFSSFPLPIVAQPKCLIKLEKLDLSNNNLAALPVEISNLLALTELNLDNNVIVSLPASIGLLKKLKSLSLKKNQLRVTNKGNFSALNPQPLPATLFSDTLVIDLNLHGNPMTSTQLNEFEGFDKFLERRQKDKSKAIHGGAMVNLSVTGLS